MLMNQLETAVVSSPPRRWLQRYEARLLRRRGRTVTAGRVQRVGSRWRTYLRGHSVIGVAERPASAGETR